MRPPATPWLPLSVLALLAPLALSCVQEASSPCEEASDRIGECYGEEAVTAFVCDPETAANVADLSCAELSDLESKSDLSLCDTLGLFCPADAIFPNPQGEAARFPLVLAHGFNGSPENEWGVNPRIIDALRLDGHKVYIARVSPFQSVEVRAQELADEVDRALAEFGSEKVNIIAHSMGGLDSRFLISSLGYDDRVAALVTISTPHHGTLVADAALGLIPELADGVIDALARALARSFTHEELANNSSLRAAFASLAESSLVSFNEAVPDAPSVYYQSWAGLSNVGRISSSQDEAACLADGGELHLSKNGKRDFMDLRLLAMAAIVAHGTSLLPNDGMATVASARWGDFKGCVPADHYDEVGQIDDESMNKATGFDAAAFYETIAYDLAARGF